MSFEDQSASGSQGVSDLLRNLLSERMWMTHGFKSSPGLDLMNDDPPFGSEVENALLELDSSKGPGPDGVHR
jgi:hypothetical protein